MPLRRQLLAADVRAGLNGHRPEAAVVAAHALASARRPLDGMLAADVETLLPDDFLVKTDRASMANGLEVRPPLLDHELLELAARIPARWKVRAGEGKWILKQAYECDLPPEVVRRPKQGFELPVDAWLRGPLRDMFEGSVLRPGGRASDLVDRAVAEKLYGAHRSGVGRHGNVLWSLLVLARWAEQYLTALPSRTPR
jgi:asparagine synthase (glutamine-hydrolysing)